MYGVEERRILCLVGKPEGRGQMGRPRHRWGIVLRWVFRKWDVGAQNGLIWLRVGRGDVYL
jgi:hypothetical protein